MGVISSHASQDEFFRDSDEFLESQIDQFQAKPILGHRLGFGPRVMVIQSGPEVNFGIQYLYDVNDQIGVGIQGFTWVEQLSQFAFGSKLIVGQASHQIGAFGIGTWWFNENLENIKLNTRQLNGRKYQNWGISGSYIKEVIPWSGFYYFPRFELEVGYRQQEFLRYTDIRGIKTSQIWLSAQLSVSLFIPKD